MERQTSDTPVMAPEALQLINHWIGGAPLADPPARTQPVYNPATGHEIARVARGGEEDVARAVAVAKAAFPGWRDASLLARENVLFRFRELVHAHREELARLVTRDHGKTYPDALGEVLRGLETIDFACGVPALMGGLITPNVSTNVDAYTIRQPLGVVAAITPFNFPIMVPLWIYPIAVATGNAVVLKPSSHTPGAIQLQAELWKEAGLPDGVFNVVYGGREAVDAILTHPDVRAVQFVGSTEVGRYVFETGSKHNKRVGAYTGAKNHMVVLPDADMELAADSGVSAGFGSAGERCMAIATIVAVGDAGDRLVEMMVDRIGRLKIGPGMEPGVDMGPIYTAEHRASIVRYIDRGVEEGATLVVDGRPFRHPEYPDGFYLGVTLFDHVRPEMTIYQDEIFGPVLTVVRVPTYADALRLVNGHHYANGTAIFTNDGGAARRYQMECETPMIGINVPIPVPYGHFSFGGDRDSMFGALKMRGQDGVRFFTKVKEVTSRWPDPSLRGVNLGFPRGA